MRLESSSRLSLSSESEILPGKLRLEQDNCRKQANKSPVYSSPSLEDKPRAELELAWSVDVVRDLPECRTRLCSSDHVGHRWVSPLRIVGHVVAREIEAERFRFSQLQRLVDGEVYISCSPSTNVVKIVWGSPRNEWIRSAAVFGSWLNKACVVKPRGWRVRSAIRRIAHHVRPLIEI